MVVVEIRPVARTFQSEGITARVLSLDPTHPWAKAGIMFRQSLEPASPYVMLFVSAERGISLQYRAVTGEQSAQAVNVPGVAPTWLRIVRIADTYSAFYSQDGGVWSELDPAALAGLGAEAHVGLALTSHDESAVAGAVFDNVTIQPLLGGDTGID